MWVRSQRPLSIRRQTKWTQKTPRITLSRFKLRHHSCNKLHLRNIHSYTNDQLIVKILAKNSNVMLRLRSWNQTEKLSLSSDTYNAVTLFCLSQQARTLYRCAFVIALNQSTVRNITFHTLPTVFFNIINISIANWLVWFIFLLIIESAERFKIAVQSRL